MRCPVCGCQRDKVLYTRQIDEERSIRRRRECTNCMHRFTSYETIERGPLIVCKRDQTRETFSRDKVMNGLKRACQKRPISLRQMEDLVDKIEADFRGGTRSEVSTTEIGERILSELREFDEVAYIRFASVYREFEGIDSFLVELDNLRTFKEAKQRQAAEEAAKEPPASKRGRRKTK